MVQNRASNKKVDTYQVCVTIIEAKHLQPNANPMVVVRVGNRKKKTAIRKNTDNPYYNEYFVFDLTCNMDELLSTKIEMAIYICGCLKRSKFHGSIDFEVATVWDQPDHQYYHKWAMLINPRNLSAGSKGYIKCNISVHSKGDKFKIPLEAEEEEDDIEGNLLLPLGDSKYFASRQQARYIFTVHQVEDIPCKIRNRYQYHIQISFAGMKASTSSSSSNDLYFDNRIVFREMFPPLCHRARIMLKCHKTLSTCCRNDTISTYLLNLKNISNFNEYGFLPTFGPSFIHLYNDTMNTTEPIYQGRLLLSLKMEINLSKSANTTGVYLESAESMFKSFWKTEEYLLVAVLYDISMINRNLLPSGKMASFEISIGNAGNRRFSQYICDNTEDSSNTDSENNISGLRTGCESIDSHGETFKEIVISLDKKYNHISFGAKKPCIFVKSHWPNTEWRIKNSNRLSLIADYLEIELERLEELMTVEQEKAYVAYNNMIRGFQHHCLRYLHSLQTMALTCRRAGDNDVVNYMTTLDKHRLNYCRMQIKGLLERFKINGELPDNRYISIAMLHAYKHLQTVRLLCKDPQHDLPDVFLWLLNGSRRLACTRIPASHIFFAEEQSERGRHCGRISNMFLEKLDENNKEDREACKMEIFLWLGNAKCASMFWNALPPGFALEKKSTEHFDIFPRYFKYTNSSKFQLRAHIFQGRFEPCMNSSNLIDPMIRIIFQGHSRVTKVIKQTLDPLWDQTLVFPSIDIHGIREYVKNHPPKVVLEAFDRDYFNILELYGRCIASPLVKLNTELHLLPKMRWYEFKEKKIVNADLAGAVLAALELIEIVENNDESEDYDESEIRVPDGIRPKMVNYRMEVIFWGVRDMKRLSFRNINKPKIVIECAGSFIESQVMENARKFSNFDNNYVIMDLEIAEEKVYFPPLTIKAFQSNGFGYFKYVGICNIPVINIFMQKLINKKEYEKIIYHSSNNFQSSEYYSIVPMQYDQKNNEEKNKDIERATVLMNYKKGMNEDAQQNFSKMGTVGKFFKHLLNLRYPVTKQYNRLESHIVDKDESNDWWSKYFASMESEKINKNGSKLWKSSIATFKVYDSELEAQPEFSGFQDRLRTFDLRRCKKLGDSKYDENNCVGKFKGYIAIYYCPQPENLTYVNRFGKSLSLGISSDFPSQEPISFLLRLYIIKAINLRPSDPLSGKADPYLLVKLGKNSISERKKYIPNQLNPTFGKVFEIEASFPKDHSMTIQVWDYDATSADDLIGETCIDIENRFYSQHRAHCGLAKYYDTTGYNAWRDREKPTEILRQICHRNNLPLPEYWNDYVKIANRKFYYAQNTKDDTNKEEQMALGVLHQWKDFPICGYTLVPEHIERRSLFNRKRPGLEQGKLEMWIDIFSTDELPVKPVIDINPHAPVDYELRVIIWNTEDVPLVDNQFLTGEKCSDIYLKGWILTDDIQKTDVHYNSLTGEGNFNWRFIFRFTFVKDEHMMITKKKTSVFAYHYTEHKMPCRFNLQVWDNDHFSKDDFLGALSLDLANMPKGSHNARNCTLKIMEPQYSKISLFRLQKTRAWWPFTINTGTGRYILAGKVEMEMSVLPVEAAEHYPVGKKRLPPEALPPPNRPDTSFSWFRNPFKACCFVVCKYYRCRILCCCCMVLLVVLIGCGIYAFPGYLVKRMLGA